MRNLLFIVFLLCLFFSCQKEYTCVCETHTFKGIKVVHRQTDVITSTEPCRKSSMRFDTYNGSVVTICK